MKIKQHENGYYYAHLRGKKHPISLRSKNIEEARGVAKELKLAEMESADRLHALSAVTLQRMRNNRRTTVDEAAQAYIKAMPGDGYAKTSIVRDSACLLSWVRRQKIGAMQIASIERRHIDAQINAPTAAKYTSRQRTLATIQSFFRFCVHSGFVYDNPAAGATVRRDSLTQKQLIAKEVTPFTEQEVRHILANLEPGSFWHAGILLAWHCGLRMGDICRLEHANINGTTLRMVTGKAGTEVLHALPAEVMRSLSAIEGERHPTYVFPEYARIIMEDNHGQSTLSHQFSRMCHRLGLEGRHFHAMRHSYALRKKQTERRTIFLEMLEQLSDKGVMEALGHRSMTSTKVYLNHGNQG